MNILGCPLKISATKQIYFPRLYIQHFGISPDESVDVIREDHEDFYIYRIDNGRELLVYETKATIRRGFTSIPAEFLKKKWPEAGRGQFVSAWDRGWTEGLCEGGNTIEKRKSFRFFIDSH
nr:hypothetical protein [uncultured Caproiciproducens sp.]